MEGWGSRTPLPINTKGLKHISQCFAENCAGPSLPHDCSLSVVCSAMNCGDSWCWLQLTFTCMTCQVAAVPSPSHRLRMSSTLWPGVMLVEPVLVCRNLSVTCCCKMLNIGGNLGPAYCCHPLETFFAKLSHVINPCETNTKDLLTLRTWFKVGLYLGMPAALSLVMVV